MDKKIEYVKCKKCETFLPKTDAKKQNGLCTLCRAKELTGGFGK